MRRLSLLALFAFSTGCAAAFTAPVATPACSRAYQDADAYITICYAICPADMEQYAKVMNQLFTRSAACHA